MADFLSKAATDRFIELNGIRLHYNDAGAGPVLLCTHGGGPGASAWGAFGDAVAVLANRYRLLLLDLPNFGESDKGVTSNGQPPDVFLAQLSRDFLDALGVNERISYCSSSGGGPAALRFAIDFPERIHKLVLQAYAPGMRPARDSPGARATAAFLEHPSRQAMDDLFEWFVPNQARRTNEVIEARWRAASMPGHLETRATFATLAANSDQSSGLATLAAEVLFIWGASDGIVPVERILTALRSVPYAQAHIWGDRTGHLVPFEHPEEFARVVTGFLAH